MCHYKAVMPSSKVTLASSQIQCRIHVKVSSDIDVHVPTRLQRTGACGRNNLSSSKRRCMCTPRVKYSLAIKASVTRTIRMMLPRRLCTGFKCYVPTSSIELLTALSIFLPGEKRIHRHRRANGWSRKLFAQSLRKKVGFGTRRVTSVFRSRRWLGWMNRLGIRQTISIIFVKLSVACTIRAFACKNCSSAAVPSGCVYACFSVLWSLSKCELLHEGTACIPPKDITLEQQRSSRDNIWNTKQFDHQNGQFFANDAHKCCAHKAHSSWDWWWCSLLND